MSGWSIWPRSGPGARRSGVITPEDAASVSRATDGRLSHFIELREALRRLIRARLSEQAIPAATLTTINATIPPVLTHTRLAAAGDEFRLEMDPLCAGEEPDHALDHLIWAIGQSAIDLLTDPDELDMIRECPGEDCGYLFRDTSRGRRRWCSMKTSRQPGQGPALPRPPKARPRGGGLRVEETKSRRDL